MNEESVMKKHRLLVKAGLFLGGIWFAGVTVWMVFLWYQTPCVVSVDVRGRQMEMAEAREWMDAWNRNHKLPGIIGVTGWRWEQAEEIYAPDTGRRSKARVVEVLGRMTEGMPFTGKLVVGNWSVGGGRKDICMVSGNLAENLFGNLDVVGAAIRMGTEEWKIAGVVEGKEELLILPGEGETIDGIAVWGTARWGRRRILEDLGESSY